MGERDLRHLAARWCGVRRLGWCALAFTRFAFSGSLELVSGAKVAVLRTSAKHVLSDYHRVMSLAGYRSVLDKDVETALKVNLSWHFFYPASSTTPWQLEGVVRALKRDGFNGDRIAVCQSPSVVLDAALGERETKQLDVARAHGLRNVHLDRDEEWVDVREVAPELAAELKCLAQVYPKGVLIPRRLVGANVVHLPTIKTDSIALMAGAMQNAWTGLLDERRHWTHPVIHEALVELLMLQKRIHRGVFAVMDGTFAGDGPGPRCLVPHVKNVILASSDQVAIDAVAGHLMGFDPLRDLKFVQLAHERGLGCGDLREIEIVGDPQILEERWNFEGPSKQSTLAGRTQQRIYSGALKKPLEWSLKSKLAPWAYVASVAYHDAFWYPTYGREQMRKVLDSEWGRLFANWGHVRSDAQGKGFPDVGVANPDLTRKPGTQFTEALRLVGKAMVESPEWRWSRKRRRVA